MKVGKKQSQTERAADIRLGNSSYMVTILMPGFDHDSYGVFRLRAVAPGLWAFGCFAGLGAQDPAGHLAAEDAARRCREVVAPLAGGSGAGAAGGALGGVQALGSWGAGGWEGGGRGGGWIGAFSCWAVGS